jgi:hypothetical protein
MEGQEEQLHRPWFDQKWERDLRTATYDVVRRRGGLEEAFESTGLFDRLVHLGIGSFGRDNVW